MHVTGHAVATPAQRLCVCDPSGRSSTSPRRRCRNAYAEALCLRLLVWVVGVRGELGVATPAQRLSVCDAPGFSCHAPRGQEVATPAQRLGVCDDASGWSRGCANSLSQRLRRGLGSATSAEPGCQSEPFSYASQRLRRGLVSATGFTCIVIAAGLAGRNAYAEALCLRHWEGLTEARALYSSQRLRRGFVSATPARRETSRLVAGPRSQRLRRGFVSATTGSESSQRITSRTGRNACAEACSICDGRRASGAQRHREDREDPSSQRLRRGVVSATGPRSRAPPMPAQRLSVCDCCSLNRLGSRRTACAEAFCTGLVMRGGRVATGLWTEGRTAKFLSLGMLLTYKKLAMLWA